MPDFLRYKNLFFLISAGLLILGVGALFLWGLRPSIDFSGGTVWELQFTGKTVEGLEQVNVTKKDLEKLLTEKGVEVINIDEKLEETFILRLKPIGNVKKEELELAFRDNFKDFTEIRYELVGPVLGRELLKKTVAGVALAAVLILFYIAWRFKEKMYGICAILAMFHDSLILLGSFSFIGYFFKVEVDTLFVTAVLTTLSFSVHDTVVTYDSIRNAVKKNPKAEFSDLVNTAISQTLIRNINNSMTIIFMLISLILLGGETIRWFVVALLIGTIAGTYSSTFVATPLLVVLREKFKKKS